MIVLNYKQNILTYLQLITNHILPKGKPSTPMNFTHVTIMSVIIEKYN